MMMMMEDPDELVGMFMISSSFILTFLMLNKYNEDTA